ncbi:MAG: hypothetical protein LBQ08_03390 [Holosporaceae bacterium]|jgi:hypothetical protein|nr:hypothetical protein [Holosporaceae bacterium]
MKKVIKLLSLTLVMGMLFDNINASLWDTIKSGAGNAATGAINGALGNNNTTTTNTTTNASGIDIAKKNKVANEANLLESELTRAKTLVQQTDPNAYSTYDYVQSRVRKLISALDILTPSDFSAITSLINGIAEKLNNTSPNLIDAANDLIDAAQLLIPDGRFTKASTTSIAITPVAAPVTATTAATAAASAGRATRSRR